jgi:hypothetical protein
MTKTEIKKALVETAVQLAYEYENWGCEHVSDMFDVCRQDGPPGFTEDDLYEAAMKAKKLKASGKEYTEAITEMMK